MCVCRGRGVRRRVGGWWWRSPFFYKPGPSITQARVLAMEISWVVLWHLHWLDCLLAQGHAVYASLRLDFCHEIIMRVLCSLLFPQVSRRCSENVGLGIAADRTVVVEVCKQCDLTHDPSCLYRIWHLLALPPLLCLVHLDSSLLRIEDVVLQRSCHWRTFLHFFTVMPQVKVWLVMRPASCFLVCVYSCRSTGGF